MCFYYSLSKLAQRYRERAENNEILRKMDLVNGFKYPEMPVVTSDGLKLMNWGLIPFWAKDEKIRQYTLNAKAETVFEKPSFKSRIATHRCIVPTNGFFEWKHSGKNTQPYYIHLKNQDSFSFAGLWDEWVTISTGVPYYTFTIITTGANPLLAEIHNSRKRMPVVLTEDIEFDWIHKKISKNEISDFLQPLHEKHFEAYPVQPFDLNAEIQENITQPTSL